jgi:hypothetical protein
MEHRLTGLHYDIKILLPARLAQRSKRRRRACVCVRVCVCVSVVMTELCCWCQTMNRASPHTWPGLARLGCYLPPDVSAVRLPNLTEHTVQCTVFGRRNLDICRLRARHKRSHGFIFGPVSSLYQPIHG